MPRAAPARRRSSSAITSAALLQEGLLLVHNTLVHWWARACATASSCRLRGASASCLHGELLALGRTYWPLASATSFAAVPAA